MVQSPAAEEYTDVHLNRGVSLPQRVCPGHDTKGSDGKTPVMLEYWGMWTARLLLPLPGYFWPKVVAPDRVLPM